MYSRIGLAEVVAGAAEPEARGGRGHRHQAGRGGPEQRGRRPEPGVRVPLLFGRLGPSPTARPTACDPTPSAFLTDPVTGAQIVGVEFGNPYIMQRQQWAMDMAMDESPACLQVPKVPVPTHRTPRTAQGRGGATPPSSHSSTRSMRFACSDVNEAVGWRGACA